MSMEFDFSDLFKEIKDIKNFPKKIKDIKKEIAKAATSEMQRAIQQVYTINAPRLRGKAQRFVIPLPKLQKAVTTEWKDNVVESYINQEKLDREPNANTNIFIDVNGGLIAKLPLYREQGLKMKKGEKERTGRQHPDEYYVRDMSEYWQMRIGNKTELEFIQDAWAFRLDAMKSYYFDEIEGCKKRWKELDELEEEVSAVEGKESIKNKTKSTFSQKELDDIFKYFIEVRNSNPFDPLKKKGR